MSFLQVILSGGTSHTPKIAQQLQLMFPKSTTIHSPSTSATALNPSELSVRGAAIQANLIQEFDKEDIEQSSHPMVTVTPHLTRAIGVMIQSKDDDSELIFHPLLEAETAIPARRTATFLGPKEGGDVLVRLCEGIREIRVSKVEKKKKEDVNGTVEKMQADSDAESDSAEDNDDDDDDDDSDDEEEEQELREKIWKVGTVLAEAAVRDVGKGKRVEVMANVASDLSVQFTAREVGGKGGVRGGIES